MKILYKILVAVIVLLFFGLTVGLTVGLAVHLLLAPKEQDEKDKVEKWSQNVVLICEQGYKGKATIVRDSDGNILAVTCDIPGNIYVLN